MPLRPSPTTRRLSKESGNITSQQAPRTVEATQEPKTELPATSQEEGKQRPTSVAGTQDNTSGIMPQAQAPQAQASQAQATQAPAPTQPSSPSPIIPLDPSDNLHTIALLIQHVSAQGNPQAKSTPYEDF